MARLLSDRRSTTNLRYPAAELAKPAALLYRTRWSKALIGKLPRELIELPTALSCEVRLIEIQKLSTSHRPEKERTTPDASGRPVPPCPVDE